MQPIFGHLSDRIGPRWVITGGMLWMGTFFALAVTVSGPAALVFLVLASLGSGAYHPAGTMQATLVGQTRFPGRETTSTSYFFLLGQGGLFLGPLVGGFILARVGNLGLLFLLLLIVPAAINAAIQLRHIKPIQREPFDVSKKAKTVVKVSFGAIALLAVLAAFRSWVQQNMMTFVPVYLNDLAYTSDVYGAFASLFMGGSAVGNVVGGTLADRFSKRNVTVVTLGAASVPLMFIPFVDGLGWLYVLIPLAGFLSGASHSIFVVLAQKLIPGGRGLASGLILGFMFSSGAVGTWLSGYLADIWGVSFVFYLSAGIAAVAAVLALGMREKAIVASA
jgi:FSR family fosmidomycin resistance protein-like MFS transporter